MTSTSRAALLVETSRPLEYRDLTLPALKAGQVLVKVAYSGLCRTQLMEIGGQKGPDKFLPHTLGHEGSGVVMEVGPKVKKVKKGDRVVLSWIKGKGADVPSTFYGSAQGSVNSGAVSTFLTHAVVSENRLVKIPSNMPLKEAALLGCAIPTGLGMLLNAVKLKKGQSVAIFGAGGIGLSAVMAAKLKKASRIIVLDIKDEKLAQAKALGATHTIRMDKQDPVAAILDLSGKLGVDVAIEAAGQSSTMEAAHRSVRDKGGLCVIAGNLPHGQRISIDPFDLIRGKKIQGTWGGESNPDKDIPVYVKLFLSKQLDLKALAKQVYPFAHLQQALKDFEDGKVGRALIEMNAE